MNKTIAAAAVLSLMAATPALAWNNHQGGRNNQNLIVDASGSQGQQQRQHQRQSQHQTATGGTAYGGTGYSTSAAISNGGSVTNNVIGGGGGSYGGISLTVPDVSSNAPCGGGISIGGLSLGGGGSAGGGLWEFADCKRIREAAALDRMGYRLEAVRELCQIDRVKDAFGGKCPALAPEPVAKPVVNEYPFDYCYTRDAGDKNQHLECDTQVTVLGRSD